MKKTCIFAMLLGLFIFVGMVDNLTFATIRLADPKVRQALNYAIDKEAICEFLLQGKAEPANSLVPDKEWKAEGLNDYSYNPEKAKKLLEEAGWDYNYELKVAYYYKDQLTVDILTVIQAYLADVGVNMSFKLYQGDDQVLFWAAPPDPINGPSQVDWDLLYAGISALNLQEFYNRIKGGTPSNSHTPVDPKLDNLIDVINTEVDPNKQKKAFYELTKYENETLPVIPLYYQLGFIVESDRVNRKGIPYGNEQFSYDWRIIDWEIETPSSSEKILQIPQGPQEYFDTPFINPASHLHNKLLFDRLIVADETLTPKKGQLASEYVMSEDGLIIEFVLRENIKWHDGTYISPQDVKFTFEYMTKVPELNEAARYTISCLEGAEDYLQGKNDNITGIILDNNKVIFKFAKVDPNALMTFSQWPILPEHLLKDSDPRRAQQSTFWQNPIGSGPFKIEKNVMGEYVIYERWQDYWDKGSGNIEKIIQYTIEVSGPNLPIYAQAGKIDYAWTKSVENAVAIENLKNMKVIPVKQRFTRLFYVNKFPTKEEMIMH